MSKKIKPLPVVVVFEDSLTVLVPLVRSLRARGFKTYGVNMDEYPRLTDINGKPIRSLKKIMCEAKIILIDHFMPVNGDVFIEQLRKKKLINNGNRKKRIIGISAVHEQRYLKEYYTLLQIELAGWLYKQYRPDPPPAP